MGTHSICLYKKVNKKYTGCNKTTEFHDCALIGVCAVIRSSTVIRNEARCLRVGIKNDDVIRS